MSVIVRKNQARLTNEERASFIAALIRLKNDTPSQMNLASRYDDYVHMHAASMPANGKGWAHRGPAFLPWHRAYLRRFEIELGVPLPYWDWTSDRSPNSPGWPLVATFLGGDGRSGDRKVMDGPFAYDSGNWTINVQPPGRPLPRFLTRSLGTDNTAPFPPTSSEVDEALKETVYDRSPWDNESRSSFRNRLEGFYGLGSLHNRIHRFIAGHMSNGHISPSDPVFFLHHANVDRIWAQWQALHPTAPYAPRDSESSALKGHRLSDPMMPWGAPVTVASTFKYWDAYRYDDVVVPNQDPVGSAELPLGMRPFIVPTWLSANVPEIEDGHHEHGFDASPEDIERFGGGHPPHGHH